MTRWLSVLFVLAAATARAEPDRSYRTQTMVVDIAGMTALTVGLLEVGKAGWHGPVGAGLTTAGITTYFVGAPVVHALHGRPVLRSIGLRLAPLAAAMLVAGFARDCEGDTHDCAFDGFTEGAASMLVTIPAALVIDWLVFSRRD